MMPLASAAFFFVGRSVTVLSSLLEAYVPI